MRQYNEIMILIIKYFGTYYKKNETVLCKNDTLYLNK